jgi:hypothetical protein
VELRADVFNVLNPSTRAGSPTASAAAGRARRSGRPGDPVALTSAAPPRQIQFSARLAF